MHIVVGLISAQYSGRGETELAPYKRIVIHKADGTVSIHGDKGFKPMNYMSSASDLTVGEVEGDLVWTFKSKKEQLVVRFHEVFDEIQLELGQDDPGHSSKDKTESQLQAWLVDNLPKLDTNLYVSAREFQTGAGPVDLLAYEHDSNTMVCVEVKREAPMNTVGQVLRYVDAVQEAYPHAAVRGVIAAVEFKASTLKVAAKKNVECLVIPPNWHENYQEGQAIEAESANPLF